MGRWYLPWESGDARALEFCCNTEIKGACCGSAPDTALLPCRKPLRKAAFLKIGSKLMEVIPADLGSARSDRKPGAGMLA